MACDRELCSAREALQKRLDDEERERRERASAKAAAQALQQASLQRELRTLQRQLVYPALTLAGPDTYPDGSSDALWAALLSETPAPSLPGPATDSRPPPSLSYHDTASEDDSVMATVRPPPVEIAATPATSRPRAGRVM